MRSTDDIYYYRGLLTSFPEYLRAWHFAICMYTPLQTVWQVGRPYQRADQGRWGDGDRGDCDPYWPAENGQGATSQSADGCTNTSVNLCEHFKRTLYDLIR